LVLEPSNGDDEAISSPSASALFVPAGRSQVELAALHIVEAHSRIRIRRVTFVFVHAIGQFVTYVGILTAAPPPEHRVSAPPP
jgi:hypothetical protein